MKITAFTLLLILVLVTSAQVQATSTAALSNALSDLFRILKARALTPEQIDQWGQIITKDIELIGAKPLVIRQAFAVADTYENEIGPLFMNDATRHGFNRKATGGLEIHRAIFALQQGLLIMATHRAMCSSTIDSSTALIFRPQATFPVQLRNNSIIHSHL